jgi:mannosyltransferase OCH1-like enzyme
MRVALVRLQRGLLFSFLVTSLTLFFIYLSWKPVYNVPFEHGIHLPASISDRIPRIIHQTYKTADIPEEWQRVQRSVKRHHKNYQYILWTDETIRVFMTEQYPWFMPTFDSYRYPIQRVDAFRYFALYHYGGIYLDLDVGCRRPLDVLLKYHVVLPRTEPFGFSNDFMAAEARHPFFKQIIEALEKSNRSYILPFLTVMLSTGPLFMTRQYHQSICYKSVVGMGRDMYNEKKGLTFHVTGSSWHHWDATMINWFWYRRIKIAWCLIAIIVLIVAVKVWSAKKSKKKENRISTSYLPVYN